MTRIYLSQQFSVRVSLSSVQKAVAIAFTILLVYLDSVARHLVMNGKARYISNLIPADVSPEESLLKFVSISGFK